MESSRRRQGSSGFEIVVAGLNAGAEAIARYFVSQGARVTVTDSRGVAELDPAIEAIRGRLRDLPVEMCLGGWDDEAFARADRIVLTSDVPRDIEPLAVARKRGVPVTGESAFALTRISEPVVAVAGTRGRAAAATLLHGMLRTAGKRSFHGGPVSPLIDYVTAGEHADIVIAELSCAEMGELTGPAPVMAVFANLDEDCRGLIESCGPQSLAVLNLDDPLCARISEESPCDVRWFSNRSPEQSASALLEGFCGAYRDARASRIGLTCQGVSESVRLERLGAADWSGTAMNSLLAAACAAHALGVHARDIERYLRSLEAEERGAGASGFAAAQA